MEGGRRYKKTEGGRGKTQDLPTFVAKTNVSEKKGKKYPLEEEKGGKKKAPKACTSL